MDCAIKNEILVINENKQEAKKLKEELKNNLGGCVASTGEKALEMIKHYPEFSDVFIPLDLKDMDYSDFIKFAKRHLPFANYILIAPPTLPDMDWLVFGKEIDGYINEPLSMPKISKYLNNFNNNGKSKPVGSDFFYRRTNPYFTGTIFSRV
ncbi:MAG: hypothetical protein VW455_12985 [Nitrospinota bacterium]